MYGSKQNKLGKIENNAKVKEGECIFPFKYKWQEHEEMLSNSKRVIFVRPL